MIHTLQPKSFEKLLKLSVSHVNVLNIHFQANYAYGEVAKRKMFKKFVNPATREAEEDVDENDDEDDEKSPGMAWLKDTYKARDTLFPGKFSSGE